MVFVRCRSSRFPQGVSCTCHGSLLEAHERERGRDTEEGERNIPSLPNSCTAPWGKRGMELGTVCIATNACASATAVLPQEQACNERANEHHVIGRMLCRDHKNCGAIPHWKGLGEYH